MSLLIRIYHIWGGIRGFVSIRSIWLLLFRRRWWRRRREICVGDILNSGFLGCRRVMRSSLL
jgi:hypothetical protein